MSGNTRMVVSSAYIPPGEVQQMRCFVEQLTCVCSDHEKVLIAMDANARNMLWDNNLLANVYSVSRRMGDILLDCLIANRCLVLNDGSPTHYTSSGGSALDVTVCKCDVPTSWKVLKDDIGSDHSAILIKVGRVGPQEKVYVKNWKEMDWVKYKERTTKVLEALLRDWDQDQISGEEMNAQLIQALLQLADELVPVRIICKHTKPWISKELSDQLQRQRMAKMRWKKRRSARNYAEYQNTLASA